MSAMTRYLNLWASLARFSLLGEMAFRGNFVLKVLVELLWLAILFAITFSDYWTRQWLAPFPT